MSDPTSLDAARSRLRARQRALAEFLADETVEEAFRSDPDAEAKRRGVPVGYALWLAEIEPKRVEAFRRTQRKKRHEHEDGERASP